VVAAIEPQLYSAEQFRSRRKPLESLDAWECVIRALSHFSQDSIAGAAAAEELCRRAITSAPDYGQAHGLLAWVLTSRARFSGGVNAVLAEAMDEVRTAIALDEQDPWAHFALGWVHWAQRRYYEAEGAFRRAVALNPNFALAYACLGCALALQGANEAAIENVERALRLNPADPFRGFWYANAMTIAQFAAGHYADTLIWARKTIEMRPRFFSPYRFVVAVAVINGDVSAATEALSTLRSLVPDYSLAWERENTPISGEVGERLLEELRKAGVPEE
jgi:adenylate cyclase